MCRRCLRRCRPCKKSFLFFPSCSSAFYLNIDAKKNIAEKSFSNLTLCFCPLNCFFRLLTLFLGVCAPAGDDNRLEYKTKTRFMDENLVIHGTFGGVTRTKWKLYHRKWRDDGKGGRYTHTHLRRSTEYDARF